MSKLNSLLPQRLTNLCYHLPQAVIANLVYGFPSHKLKVIGVTGTDGKTTTVNILYHLLVANGYSAAMVSTVGAKIGADEIDTGFHVTSPDPWLLQKLLRQMVGRGVQYVVLEVTSHGLDQYRFWGIPFETAILTNITHEHLDYHKNFAAYQAIKLSLFTRVKYAIANLDDQSYGSLAKRLSKQLASNKTRLISYSLGSKADYTPNNIPFTTLLDGNYNQSNCLAALAAAETVSIPREKLITSLATFQGVTGRMERVDCGQDFSVIVDFAHTPNALEQSLTTLKAQLVKKTNRLIVVFGSAGLRDASKRPLMGETAGRLADVVVLTAEDPRTESVAEICRQITVGVHQAGKEPTVIADRKQAIDYATKLARPGDIVAICGKGHEKAMCFESVETPWSDQEVASQLLTSIIKTK